MNRQQLRALQKKTGKKLTREEFDQILAIQRIQNGYITKENVQKAKGYVVIDDKDRFPDGTEVMFNYEYISERFAKSSQEYKDFIESHKDEVLHITRSPSSVTNRVGIFEDNCTMPNGEGRLPWLFSALDDFLVHTTDESEPWKDPWKVYEELNEETHLKEYSIIVQTLPEPEPEPISEETVQVESNETTTEPAEPTTAEENAPNVSTN